MLVLPLHQPVSGVTVNKTHRLSRSRLPDNDGDGRRRLSDDRLAVSGAVWTEMKIQRARQIYRGINQTPPRGRRSGTRRARYWRQNGRLLSRNEVFVL